MSPRHDHRGPAVAFALLFLIALLMLGNGLWARAAVTANPALPSVVRALVSPPRHLGPRPSTARAKPASPVAARHVTPSRPSARPSRTDARTHRSRRAEDRSPRTVRSVPLRPDRDVAGRAVGSPGERPTPAPARQRVRTHSERSQAPGRLLPRPVRLGVLRHLAHTVGRTGAVRGVRRPVRLLVPADSGAVERPPLGGPSPRR